MRPLKLSIQAFGPYVKPLALDFAENLRGKKIFLINGATGAGKTTILDAICFALYGTASGDERDAAMMRSKGIAADVKTVVEFSFALGEKIFDVRRTLSYHPNRKTNQNQISAELKRDGQTIETQATRVTNSVTELLGFNAKQFRQVVLLPQGEFKNFLAAGSDDRQPILDALFNAELYRRIELGLQNKADAAQKVFDDLELEKKSLTAQLQGITPDAAALEEIRAEFVAAQKKSAAVKKILDTVQSECTAAEILAKDFVELARREKNLVAAQKNFDDAEKNFATAKTEFDHRADEQTQREQLKADADKLTEIKKSLAALEDKRNALAAAEKNFQKVTDALKNLSDEADRFDRRLAELKRRRADLTGAEKILAQMQTTFDKVLDRERILQEISRLETDLRNANKKISAAEKNSDAAKIELERLQKLQRDGSATLLAKNLRDGEPCPVCGSTNHPKIACREEIIPSDSEIDAAQKKSDRCKKILDDAKISAAQTQTAIETKRDDLKKFADLPDRLTAQKNLDAAQKNSAEFADCEKRIAKGEKCIADNKTKLESAHANQNSAATERARRLGELQTFQAQIPQNYLDDRPKLDGDIAATEKLLRQLDAAWKVADKNFRTAADKKSSCEGALNSAQEAHRELSDKLREKILPDVAALKISVQTAQKNFNDAIREETSLKNSLDTLTNLSAKISALDEKISAAEKNLRVWRKLSDAAGGKIRGNKLSFARYYLGAMFDQVLTEANYRLEKMSDRRYNLRSRYAGNRADSKLGLNLEIFDEYTGETRPVATLSGGESFLASLSLALGLAAVVRNNLGGIKLDTIFIDEGFGSLDTETLDDAIKTIIEQSGGRLVGIISHVEELKNQMPVRLEVIKGKTGSTAKFVS